jgi:hypothetical protein
MPGLLLMLREMTVTRGSFSERLLTKPTNNMLVQSKGSWKICSLFNDFLILGFDSITVTLALELIGKSDSSLAAQ